MPDWRDEVRRVAGDSGERGGRGAGSGTSADSDDIVSELAQHLEDTYRHALANGATEAEARARALDELSGRDAHALLAELARLRPSRPGPIPLPLEAPSNGGGRPLRAVMTGMWQDLRYAWRLLRRDPWFTVTAVLTLALGIGANGAIFSFVNAVLLDPLPYDKPGELVMIWESRPREGVTGNVVSPADFLDWRTRQRSFDGIAAHWSQSVNLTGSGEPERIDAGNISASLFSVLGVTPALGRDFRADEEQTGRNLVVMLTHGFWARRFGSNPAAIGTAISLDGQPHEIVGVLPASFRFVEQGRAASGPSSGASIDVWRPLDFTLEENRARFNHFLAVYARLKEGVTIDRAQQDLDAISAQLHKEVELQNQGHGATVIALDDQLLGGVRPSLAMLMAAASVILLIACVNIANLLLVRGATRRREVALRSALGASHSRIVRQFVFECLIMAGLGALVAVPIAMWSIELLKSSVPTDVPRLEDAGLTVTVIAFMAGVASVTALLFSLAPAWQVRARNLGHALNAGGARAGTSTRRTRRALVIAEIALAFVLLVGAGLMTRTLANIVAVDTGFDSRHVLTVPIALAGTPYVTPAQQAAFFGALLDGVRAQPGIHSAGYVSHVPMSGEDSRAGIGIEGRAPDPSGEPTRAHWRVATPGYFQAMQYRLLRGRFPDDADLQSRALVAVINRNAAERYWPGIDPVGKRVRLQQQWREIIGVVDDVRHWGPVKAVNPEVYVPGYWGRSTLIVRGAQDPATLTAIVREQVRKLSPSLPLTSVRTMEDVRSTTVASPRFYLILLSTLGAVALLLAVIGVYGLTSYSVAQSRRDIGVRMAMGARGQDVVRMFVRESMTLTACGLALGIAGALALTRLMNALLFGVTPTDTATFAAMGLLMAMVAMLASYIPARRSASVDPLIALRDE